MKSPHIYRITISMVLFFIASRAIYSQSMYFGLKGGPTIAYQQWNGFQGTNPLLTYHIMAHLESYGKESVFYLNAGLNNKGRGLRYNDYINPISGRVVRGGYINVIFKNIELGTGIKKYFPFGDQFEFFYSFGLRGSYTYDAKYGNINYITNDAIRKWNYGVSAGGGIRFIQSEFVRPLLHISFSPDLSQQVNIPPQEYDSPSGNRFTVPEQQIRNISLEIGITMQFLRKVIYR